MKTLPHIIAITIALSYGQLANAAVNVTIPACDNCSETPTNPLGADILSGCTENGLDSPIDVAPILFTNSDNAVSTVLAISDQNKLWLAKSAQYKSKYLFPWKANHSVTTAARATTSTIARSIGTNGEGQHGVSTLYRVATPNNDTLIPTKIIAENEGSTMLLVEFDNNEQWWLSTGLAQNFDLYSTPASQVNWAYYNHSHNFCGTDATCATHVLADLQVEGTIGWLKETTPTGSKIVTFIDPSSSSAMGLALLEDGTVWEKGFIGAAGGGLFVAQVNLPADIVEISAAASALYALTANGDLYKGSATNSAQYQYYRNTTFTLIDSDVKQLGGIIGSNDGHSSAFGKNYVSFFISWMMADGTIKATNSASGSISTISLPGTTADRFVGNGHLVMGTDGKAYDIFNAFVPAGVLIAGNSAAVREIGAYGSGTSPTPMHTLADATNAGNTGEPVAPFNIDIENADVKKIWGLGMAGRIRGVFTENGYYQQQGFNNNMGGSVMENLHQFWHFMSCFSDETPAAQNRVSGFLPVVN